MANENLLDNHDNDEFSLKKYQSPWYLSNIHIILFLLLWFGYAIISILALFLSSGGWTALMMLVYGFIFYGILSLIVLVTASNKLIAKKFKVTVDDRILLILIFVHLLALTGNIGDCGDFTCNGPANFGYRITYLLGFSNTVLGSFFTTTTAILGPIAAVGYFVILFSFLLSTLFGKITYKVVKFSLLTIVVVGSIFFLIFIRSIVDDIKFTTSVQNHDPEGCVGINSYTKKKDCYAKIAKETRDATICDDVPLIKDPSQSRLPAEAMRDACYMAAVEGIVPTYEVCNKISYARTKNDCFVRVGDEKACASIVDGYDNSKDRCYKELGVRLRDNIYCEKIVASDWKNACYNQVDFYKKNRPIREN